MNQRNLYSVNFPCKTIILNKYKQISSDIAIKEWKWYLKQINSTEISVRYVKAKTS